LKKQKGRGIQLLEQKRFVKSDLDPWRNTVKHLLGQAFGADAKYYQTAFQNWQSRAISMHDDEDELYAEDAMRRLPVAVNTLADAISVLEEGCSDIQKHSTRDAQDSLGNIRLVLRRFHLVARQLERRHADRNTIEVTDEYDVQDILHALLKIFFSDIRPEEWTPSYAGGSGRVDFLLKLERIVIEVKKTRKSLSIKQIGEQLIVDIDRYKNVPDCDTLICFVYDPEGLISNPTGLKSDLSGKKDTLQVEVIVEPSSQ
jgi:hypothetical protein